MPAGRCYDCERPIEWGSRCQTCNGVAVPAEDHSIKAIETPGVGGTPIVETPTLADGFGLESVTIKLEGHNLTGSIADRGATILEQWLPSDHPAIAVAGAGQRARAVAAMAARSGVRASLFVPARCPFVQKAMINVYGGDMTVIQGGYDAAVDAAADSDAIDITPGTTAGWIVGAASAALELAAHWNEPGPDGVVVPAGTGTVALGLYHGFEEARSRGTIASIPTLYVVQPAGSARIVEEAGDMPPDTICGELEVERPPYAKALREAIEATGGTGITVEDDRILEAGTMLASHEGIGLDLAGATAIAGIETITARDTDIERLTVLSPGGPDPEADRLRSHLMGQGH